MPPIQKAHEEPEDQDRNDDSESEPGEGAIDGGGDHDAHQEGIFFVPFLFALMMSTAAAATQ